MVRTPKETTSALAITPAEMPESLRKLHEAVITSRPVDAFDGTLLELYVLHCGTHGIRVPQSILLAALHHFADIAQEGGSLDGVQTKIRSALRRALHKSSDPRTETDEHRAMNATEPEHPRLQKEE